MDRAAFLKKLPFWLAAQGIQVLEAKKRQRPPGAMDEPSFTAECSGCDQCMAACPHNVIMIEDMEARLPVIFPEEAPCLSCEGYPCVASCPTDALSFQNSLELRDL